VSDITYVATEEGWLYVAVVLDLYSRLVVGWAMSERMTAKLVCDALRMALWRRKMPTGVIVTREVAKAQVFEYIEVYYNRRRLHSRLGNLSPETFEARQMA
jgi:transposase InsO family protein